MKATRVVDFATSIGMSALYFAAAMRDNGGGPIDFALIDGWPLAQGPTLARQVIELLAPQLRVGGYILNDNAEPDFLDYIRDPPNGFISVTLPIKRGTELALKIR